MENENISSIPSTIWRQYSEGLDKTDKINWGRKPPPNALFSYSKYQITFYGRKMD